jgi:hypothetical protein
LVRITEAVSQLYAEAAAGRIVPVEAMSAEALIPRARELLGLAEARVLKEMSRNVFLREDAAADPNAGVKLDVPSPAENPPFGPDGEPIDE